jgi:nicotinamidase-related amidase
MTTNTALLIIDVQIGLMEEAYQSGETLDRIRTLLADARKTNTPIIYVQHDGPAGHGLEVGTPPWHIHPSIAPAEGDVVVHKRASDSFYDTTLHSQLTQLDIKQLVVAGGQTEYCVDTTVRRATTMGYTVTLVGDAHTTYDSEILSAAQIIAHTNDTLNGFRTDEYRIGVKPTAEIVF